MQVRGYTQFFGMPKNALDKATENSTFAVTLGKSNIISIFYNELSIHKKIRSITSLFRYVRHTARVISLP